MKKRVTILILTGAIFALAPAGGQQRGINVQSLRGYFDRMGLQSVAHPKSQNALVITRAANDHADRLNLYAEIRDDNTLVLTAYAKKQERYFSLSRAINREELFQRLLEANHSAFATFFVDKQGDIGVRFTFTTENGVGFESFRVAATELLRIADHYTPVLEEHMRKG
jgi:hypothetical protein